MQNLQYLCQRNIDDVMAMSLIELRQPNSVEGCFFERYKHDMYQVNKPGFNRVKYVYEVCLQEQKRGSL